MTASLHFNQCHFWNPLTTVIKLQAFEVVYQQQPPPVAPVRYRLPCLHYLQLVNKFNGRCDTDNELSTTILFHVSKCLLPIEPIDSRASSTALESLTGSVDLPACSVCVLYSCIFQYVPRRIGSPTPLKSFPERICYTNNIYQWISTCRCKARSGIILHIYV